MSAPDSPDSPEYKYWAFLSYSHQDNLPVRGGGVNNNVRVARCAKRDS